MNRPGAAAADQVQRGRAERTVCAADALIGIVSDEAGVIAPDLAEISPGIGVADFKHGAPAAGRAVYDVDRLGIVRNRVRTAPARCSWCPKGAPATMTALPRSVSIVAYMVVPFRYSQDRASVARKPRSPSANTLCLAARF